MPFNLPDVTIPPIDVSGVLAPVAYSASSFVNNIANAATSLAAEEVTRTEGTNDRSILYSGSLVFPSDVGTTHHPDSISFFLLDLVTKEGGKEQFAASVATGRQYVGDATKKAVNGAILGGRPALTEAMGTAAKNLASGSSLLSDSQKAATVAFVDEQLTAPTYAQTGDSVTLMMPAALEISSSAGWQAVNATPSALGLLADIVLTDNSLADVTKFEVNKWVQGMLYEGGEGVAASLLKKNVNPYVSQAFESMQRRSFRFSWTLTPKNEAELIMVKDIIRTFRWHMHPLLETNQSFLRFPSQVDIKFNTDTGENEWIPKIATCVIKDFATNYTPNNQWSTSNASTGGAPYQFQISVVVEEVVPLVKTDIMRGY